jgi:hypothetical protein
MQTPRGLNWGRDAEGWTKIGLASASRESWVSLRQESSRKGEVARTQKPFVATLRVNESRPAELGQSACGGEASLAWGGVTLTAKRRQRVPMPCYRAPKYASREPPL